VIPQQQIVKILSNALPKHRLESFEPLTGGTRNLNYLLHLQGAEDRFVLRIYIRDRASCQKEIDLNRLVCGQIPVPEILYADPTGEGYIGPYMLKRYVDGVTFQVLKAEGSSQDVAEGAYCIGATLAQFQTLTPARSGRICEAITRESDVSATLGRYLNAPLMEQRLGVRERDRLRDFISPWIPQLMSLDRERLLVHGDFGARNTVVQRSGGRWRVSAVLDWELAFSGSPLWDAARFICFERRARPMREPHFSRGFSENGGSLPKNWTEFSRIVNVVSSTESLSRPELPEAVVSELKNLVLATMEGRDPP
jgi:aminoglycoside phosphotransferase (APT) family kinase protein